VGHWSATSANPWRVGPHHWSIVWASTSPRQSNTAEGSCNLSERIFPRITARFRDPAGNVFGLYQEPARTGVRRPSDRVRLFPPGTTTTGGHHESKAPHRKRILWGGRQSSPQQSLARDSPFSCPIAGASDSLLSGNRVQARLYETRRRLACSLGDTPGNGCEETCKP